MTLWLAVTLAFATEGFDASTPAERFEGAETFTADGAVKLWSAIERIEDPDRVLLTPDAFSQALEWPQSIDYAPFIRDCFGTARPGSHQALLHMGLSEPSAEGTPILMVHGAGDNGSRSFVTMATRLDRGNRPVYALTFAHPHGDVYKQAELIADAIDRIKSRTGAEQVDLVAHSKGGISAAIYLSNRPGYYWDNAEYEAVGTPYRDDVRRAVFIAAPLAGTDTTYRWSANNYGALNADFALTPSSWSTYYPTGSGAWWNRIDLADQDHLSDGDDLFPGQRQILARQPYVLPGSDPTLGAYAYQQDWYTTYEGGFGFYSYSEGIDAAVDDGGDVIARLQTAGVDPDVELFILAGNSPLLSNGIDWATALYGDVLGAAVGESADAWAEFVGDLVGDGFLGEDLSSAEVTGILRGDLILGEITGDSDGVVFVSSATHTQALTARGAQVSEVRLVELSHLDMLYASPVTGQLLIDAADGPGGAPWQRTFGQRYIDEDPLGWVEQVLADDGTSMPAVESDDPNPQEQPLDDDDDIVGETPEDSGVRGCGCTSAGSAPVGWLLGFGVVVGLLRRRR